MSRYCIETATTLVSTTADWDLANIVPGSGEC